jgi:hypothetical protein
MEIVTNFQSFVGDIIASQQGRAGENRGSHGGRNKKILIICIGGNTNTQDLMLHLRLRLLATVCAPPPQAATWPPDD